MAAPETTWQDDVAYIARLLSSVSFADAGGNACGADEGFDRWRSLTSAVRDARRAVYLVGNGASASMASHFSADLAKNARLHTQVFSDLSLITAISNDLGYEAVFSEPLRRRGQPGDLLVAISSSGRSANILRAVDTARGLGLCVVTLSAMSSDNPLRSKGDVNIYVAADSYGYAETCHAAILHHWLDLMVEE